MKETILDRLLNVIDRKVKQHNTNMESTDSKLMNLKEQINSSDVTVFKKAIETRDLYTLNKGAVMALEELRTLIAEVNDKYKKQNALK
jgi:hypothetical protein